jgi:hypothetical protein
MPIYRARGLPNWRMADDAGPEPEVSPKNILEIQLLIT